eukprot:6857530-Alexandrium_andersonii.AAC.2
MPRAAFCSFPRFPGLLSGGPAAPPPPDPSNKRPWRAPEVPVGESERQLPPERSAGNCGELRKNCFLPVSYTHLRAHETSAHL